MRKEKGDKIVQLGRRVFAISETNFDKAIDLTIEATKDFFKSLGINASKEEYGVTKEVISSICRYIDQRGVKLGDRHNIDGSKVANIFDLCD